MVLFSSFVKIKLLQINHPGPLSECQTVRIEIKTFCWSLSGFKLLAKVYWQATHFSAGMQRVLTGKYFKK